MTYYRGNYGGDKWPLVLVVLIIGAVVAMMWGSAGYQ
jgi:hypothetical protein